MHDNYNIKIWKSVSEIENNRSIWEEFISRETEPSINTDIDRYLSVLEGSNGKFQPYIICAERENCPDILVIGRLEKFQLDLKIGYLNLFQTKLRCLSIVYKGVLGNTEPDACHDLIVKLKKMFGTDEFDMIFFNNLERDIHLYGSIRKNTTFFTCAQLAKQAIHWQMKVPHSIDAFYSGCSKKHRGNIKRYIRKLEQEFGEQFCIKTYKGEDDLYEIFTHIPNISKRTYQNSLNRGFVDDFQTRNIIRSGLQKGTLQIAVLFIKYRPCAFQVGTILKNVYQLETIGFDPDWKRYSVGTVLFVKTLETLCDIGEVKKLDFGFGNADYKERYGDLNRREISMGIFTKRPRFILMALSLSLTIIINRAAEGALNMIGQKNRVKRKWRDQLQKRNRCNN